MSTFTHGILLTGLLLAIPGIADNAGAAARQKAESYRLTMPAIRTTFQAYSELVELLAADPALVAKYKAVQQTLPDTNGRDTMGLTAAKLLATEPRVAAVFHKAGMTPGATVTTFETLLGVMFGDAMLQSSKGADESKLPPFVADNLAFYRQNKASIESEFKQFAAKAGSLGKVRLDDEESDDEVNEDEQREEEGSERD